MIVDGIHLHDFVAVVVIYYAVAVEGDDYGDYAVVMGDYCYDDCDDDDVDFGIADERLHRL